MSSFEPEIIAYCCHHCAFAAADLAGAMRLSYPANVKIVRLPCTGKLDLIHILKSFEDGADGVVIMGCLEGTCHFLKGNLRARKRVEYMQRLLAEIRIEPERVEMFNISSSDGPSFAAIASQMTDRIRSLGPLSRRQEGGDI